MQGWSFQCLVWLKFAFFREHLRAHIGGSCTHTTRSQACSLFASCKGEWLLIESRTIILLKACHAMRLKGHNLVRNTLVKANQLRQVKFFAYISRFVARGGVSGGTNGRFGTAADPGGQAGCTPSPNLLPSKQGQELRSSRCGGCGISAKRWPPRRQTLKDPQSTRGVQRGNGAR